MSPPVFHVAVAVQGLVTVLRPVGWVIASNRGQIEERFKAAVCDGATRFVVDLSSAHFPDNSGLLVFASWKGTLNDLGGCLVLASPSGSAMRAIMAGRLNKYLPVCETVAEAVELARQRTESGRWKPVTV